MGTPAAHLADILREQSDLLTRLDQIVAEHRHALLARQPERADAAQVRLQTLALRFRMLDDARAQIVEELIRAHDLPAESSLAELVRHRDLASTDLVAAFADLRRAAARAVRAGAIHTRFIQRSMEAGEGLRRLFDWAAGGSYTATGDVAASGPRTSWEGRA